MTQHKSQNTIFFWVTGVPRFCLHNFTAIPRATIAAKSQQNLGAIESNGNGKRVPRNHANYARDSECQGVNGALVEVAHSTHSEAHS